MTSLGIEEAVRAAAQAYPKPAGFRPSYGTAGFRALASLLPSTVFRCGVLLAARSLKLDAPTGICITASHNPAPDNGVKLVEPTGEMLVQEWEAHADALVRAEGCEDFLAALRRLLLVEAICLPSPGAPPNRAVLYIAHDTRPSSPSLAVAAAAGAAALGVATHMLGLLTTPQLHWAVARAGRGARPLEEEYFAELAGAYAALTSRPAGSPSSTLHVDCANGVGAPKLAALATCLPSPGLRLELHGTGSGTLNGGCGADYVQKARVLPDGMGAAAPDWPCASLDGDADRIVFFIPASDGTLTLLDGDRIAALAAMLCHDVTRHLPTHLQPRMGVVQTAYANGASSAYIGAELGLPIAVTPTGVKHLHAAAHAFDIGIYFEANGHGTVLFKPAFLQSLREFQARQHASNGKDRATPAWLAAQDILSLSVLVNQSIGDALSILLLVEVALLRREWSLADWAATYADLPSRQLVRNVADRSVIVTTDAERRVASPAALQPAVDAAVAAVPKGRAFVRPSGTEDVVRVYAEAATQAQADALAAAVGDLVAVHAGGM